MEVKDLLKTARGIWGEEPQNLDHITLAMGVVYGDICRQARTQKEQGIINNEELQKELGNMLFSLIRWCDDLGYDPETCITRAIKAQRLYISTLQPKPDEYIT